MSIVRSSWALTPVVINGDLQSAEWSGAGRLALKGLPDPLPPGPLPIVRGASAMLVKNDDKYLYIALDLIADTAVDPQDYFWFSVDVDNNGKISPMRDVNYGLYPAGSTPALPGTRRIGRQYYLGAGRWTALIEDGPPEYAATSFGKSGLFERPHRRWEFRIKLSEIGVDLATASAPPVVRFGVHLSSQSPAYSFDAPPGFTGDFSNLHQIILATRPDPTYPPGTEGPVIAGVGRIPASVITDGFATTDASYVPHVVEAVFGATLDIIGNRATAQAMWNAGVRRYRVLHRFETETTMTPLYQSWSNYRRAGTTDVLEHFGPDSAGAYPLLDPSVQYSISDLLIQWNTVGAPSGLHYLQVEFLDAGGNVVPTPTSQVLALWVDNNPPTAALEDILHNGASIAPCAFESIASGDSLQLKLTAFDAEGHLGGYSVEARWGANQSATIYSEDYTTTTDPAVDRPHHVWQGRTSYTVTAQQPGSSPPAAWHLPQTCAYEFRVVAWSRVTNGYGYISSWREATRHITLIATALTPA